MAVRSSFSTIMLDNIFRESVAEQVSVFRPGFQQKRHNPILRQTVARQKDRLLVEFKGDAPRVCAVSQRIPAESRIRSDRPAGCG